MRSSSSTERTRRQLTEHQRLTGTEPKDEGRRHDPPRPPRQGRCRRGRGRRARRARRPAAAAPAKSGAFTGTLRVITLGVEFPTPEVEKRIKKDLGFDVALTADRPGDEVQKAITAPETFDIFGGYNYQDIQALVDASPAADRHARRSRPGRSCTSCSPGARCTRARRRDLRRRRRSVPRALPQAGHERAAADEGRAEVEQGHRPVDQRDDRQAVRRRPMPRYIVGTPAHFNADSIGYNADVIKKQPNQVGWAGAPEQEVEGPGRPAEGPGHRHAGHRQRAQGPGHLQAQGHGQHDARPRSTGSSRSRPRTRRPGSSAPTGRTSTSRST